MEEGKGRYLNKLDFFPLWVIIAKNVRFMLSEFKIPFAPVQENRHRTKYIPQSGRFIHYSNQSDLKRLITNIFIEQNKQSIMYSCALKATYLFYMPIPKTKTKKIKEGDWHIVRPDDDNIEKIYKDCLTKAGILKDDCIICYTIKMKIYSNDPRVEIKLESLE